VATLAGAAALVAAPMPVVKPKPRAATKPVAAPPAPQFTREGIDYFEKNVRPLLVESCAGCHNAKLASPMGGLRLDTRALAMKGGDRGPSVVPGDLEKSLLIRAVRYNDRVLQMPPKGKLKPEQIEALEAWVKMGAPWPASAKPHAAAKVVEFDLKARRDGHWSFQPLKRQPVPVVRRKEWPQTPVDNFVLGKLEARGFAPAAPADRRTLIRRITQDLTGLPPTREEVDAFLADREPDAYEKLVERLLASPRYGERWGRHWLDLVRFAETDGHEFDFEKPNAWVYRDYVIRALNADVPYNQFVKEHIAGDLMQTPRRDPTDGTNQSVTATGFWFLGEGKHSPVDLLEDEAERVDNQIDVLSRATLGLSVGCARCHDHKFDPISTKDYYALSGILKSTRFELADINDPAPTSKVVAGLQRLIENETPAALQALLRSAPANPADVGRYLLAARSVLNPSIEVAQASSKGADVVYEDFEKPAYEGWTTTGSAFGDRPNRMPIPSYQGELNAMGKGFVNTHSALLGGERQVGDRLTGTLTSGVFTIEKPFIRFLVGGGAHAGKTCVNLKLEGKVARTALGSENNRMDWTQWDVKELIGKQAQIEIVDQVTGPWGNIGVDQITFSSSPGAEDRAVQLVAAREGLDTGRLQSWVRHLRERAEKDPADLLHPIAALKGVSPEGFADAKARLAEKLKALNGAPRAGERVYADFSTQGLGDWIPAGDAFGEATTARPLVRIDGKSNTVTAVSAPGLAHSGAVSDRLHGVLRSPTFRIEKAHILYRMAGRDAQVNLIIDNFQRIRAPIYGGLTLGLKGNDRPQWYLQDVAQWIGHKAYIEFVDRSNGYVAIDEVRFSDQPAPAEQVPPAVLRLLADPTVTSFDTLSAAYGALFATMGDKPQLAAVPAAEQAVLLDWMARSGVAADTMATDEALNTLRREREKLEQALPTPLEVMAAADGPGENDKVHVRGRHQTLGDDVPRRFLEAISGGDQPPVKSGSGRLEIAERMTSAENPLFPRVLVNRVWTHHFGEGLVRTPDDFGLRGEKPTHPELLDWLTAAFVAPVKPGTNGCGWSLKKLHRLIVLSSTYQMASKGDPRATAADPQNRLLHRTNVRRLEAEAIRDSILLVSGKLDTKMYGPGVLPHLTPFMEGRGRPGSSGPLDGQGRRSVYINVRRNFLTPMFLAFDYPIPFSTMGKRSVSTVPAQALTLMNNPFIVQQAGYWGRQALSEPELTPRQRIVRMYEQAYSRPPTDTEANAALVFIAEQDKAYGTANDPRSWGDLAHVLINVKEFIFLN